MENSGSRKRKKHQQCLVNWCVSSPMDWLTNRPSTTTNFCRDQCFTASAKHCSAVFSGRRPVSMPHPAERFLDSWLTHMLSWPKSGAVADKMEPQHSMHATSVLKDPSWHELACTEGHFQKHGNSIQHHIKITFLLPSSEENWKKEKNTEQEIATNSYDDQRLMYISDWSATVIQLS